MTIPVTQIPIMVVSIIALISNYTYFFSTLDSREPLVSRETQKFFLSLCSCSYLLFSATEGNMAFSPCLSHVFSPQRRAGAENSRFIVLSPGNQSPGLKSTVLPALLKGAFRGRFFRPGRDRAPIAHRCIGGIRGYNIFPSRRDVRRYQAGTPAVVAPGLSPCDRP